MKRKKRKTQRKGREWVIIHDALANILEKMKIFKVTKDHFRQGYYGRLKDLRREVIRILNAIDEVGTEKMKLDESPLAPDRWE
jgi:hypothetical protein